MADHFRRSARAILALGLGLTLVPSLVQPAQAACRQALALGLDVSGSVDADEYRLQLDGLAGALTNPDVVAAFTGGPAAPVRFYVYEWSGPRYQREIIDWVEVVDAATLAQIAAQLRATGRVAAAPSTALGVAIVSGAEALAGHGECWKRTLDISGDGTSNTGPRPQDIGTTVALDGVTVNALVVGIDPRQSLSATGNLIDYFRQTVIRGPDAFVEHAAGFADFEAAMVRKLLRETEGLAIGQSDPPGADPQTDPAPGPQPVRQ